MYQNFATWSMLNVTVFITYRMFVAIHLNHHRSLHHLPHVCCHPSEPSSQSSSPTTCLLPFIWTVIAVFITYHMFVAIHLNHHRSLQHLPHVCCHSAEPSLQSSSPTTCLLPFIWTVIAVFITYHMFVAIHLNRHRSLHHLPHVCCHSSEPSSQSSSPTTCLLPFIWTVIAVFITYLMFAAIHLNRQRSLHHLPHVCCHPSEPSSQSSPPTTCLLPFIWTIIAVFITYHMFVAIHLDHQRSLHHLPHVCCHPSEPSSQFSSPTTCLLPFIWIIIAVFITYHMFVAIHLNHHRSLHHHHTSIASECIWCYCSETLL